MDDLAAFLETIRLHPDDDAPRLIYADWLDDRGDIRAGFIRLQCRIAELDKDDKERIQLQVLEKKLISAHWQAFLLEDMPKGSYTSLPAEIANLKDIPEWLGTSKNPRIICLFMV